MGALLFWTVWLIIAAKVTRDWTNFRKREGELPMNGTEWCENLDCSFSSLTSVTVGAKMYGADRYVVRLCTESLEVAFSHKVPRFSPLRLVLPRWWIPRKAIVRIDHIRKRFTTWGAECDGVRVNFIGLNGNQRFIELSLPASEDVSVVDRWFSGLEG
jgi:hypothetical protein